MKTGLVIVSIWSAVLLFLSLTIVGALGPIYAGSYYPFTLPFIVFSGISILAPISGLVAKQIRATMFWFAIPLHGLLFLPFYYAIKRWPGGDDGPGMAWLIFIGGGSCIAGLIALMSAIKVGMSVVRRKSKGTEPSV